MIPNFADATIVFILVFVLRKRIKHLRTQRSKSEHKNCVHFLQNSIFMTPLLFFFSQVTHYLKAKPQWSARQGCGNTLNKLASWDV